MSAVSTDAAKSFATSRILARAAHLAEAAVRNKTGNRCHDSETGKPAPCGDKPLDHPGGKAPGKPAKVKPAAAPKPTPAAPAAPTSDQHASATDAHARAVAAHTAAVERHAATKAAQAKVKQVASAASKALTKSRNAVKSTTTKATAAHVKWQAARAKYGAAVEKAKANPKSKVAVAAVAKAEAAVRATRQALHAAQTAKQAAVETHQRTTELVAQAADAVQRHVAAEKEHRAAIPVARQAVTAAARNLKAAAKPVKPARTPKATTAATPAAPAQKAAPQERAGFASGTGQLASAPAEAKHAILSAVGDEPAVDIATIRKKLGGNLKGQAFDDAILALADAGHLHVHRDMDAMAAEAKGVDHVKDGGAIYTSVTVTDQGKKALRQRTTTEAVVRNKTGPGCHDTQTGHPASCGTGASAPPVAPAKKQPTHDTDTLQALHSFDHAHHHTDEQHAAAHQHLNQLTASQAHAVLKVLGQKFAKTEKGGILRAALRHHLDGLRQGHVKAAGAPPLKIADEVIGSHSGQLNSRLTAHTPDGKLAAYLEYSVYEGKPHIDMVKAEQQGLRAGEKLVDELAKQHGYENVQWGMMTPDGSKLRDRMDQKYGIERKTETVDLDAIASEAGGKVLSKEDGRELGSEKIYVEFDSVESGQRFADKLRSMGAEDVDVQDGGNQSWVDATVVTKRHVVRKRTAPTTSAPAAQPSTPRDAVLAAFHRLARDNSVSLADLADHTKLPLPQLHAAIQQLRRDGTLSGSNIESDTDPRLHAAAIREPDGAKIARVGLRRTQEGEKEPTEAEVAATGLRRRRVSASGSGATNNDMTRATIATEAVERNKTGTHCHDTETGHPAPCPNQSAPAEQPAAATPQPAEPAPKQQRTLKDLLPHSDKLARSHYRNMLGLLVQAKQGKYDHKDAVEDADIYHKKALKASQAKFVGIYQDMKAGVAKHYGEDALQSPEWTAVKRAFHDGINSVGETLADMTDVVQSTFPYSEDDDEEPNWPKLKNTLDLKHNEVVDRHNEAVHKIVDAFLAFRAKQDGKRPTQESSVRLARRLPHPLAWLTEAIIPNRRGLGCHDSATGHRAKCPPRPGDPAAHAETAVDAKVEEIKDELTDERPTSRGKLLRLLKMLVDALARQRAQRAEEEEEEEEGAAAYGLCPECGKPGVMRERRLNGNDRCSAGHTYPSRSAVPANESLRR